jgi:Zn-dependent protease with chaperone function
LVLLVPTTAHTAADRNCPECGRATPTDEGLPRWCEHCDWNIASHRIIGDEGFLARTYIKIGKRRGRMMLAALISAPIEDLRPRLTLAKAAAFLVGGAVHLLSIGFGVAGLLIALADFPNAGLLLIGLACCGIGWLSLPRPMRIPKERLAQKDFPVLHAFVNEVAAGLGGAPIGQIIVDENFNASFAVAGWRREPVLHLGLPLWIILSPQERVALVAHEVAHGVNGDSTRGFIVGTALQALGEWIALFRGSQRPLTGTEALAGYVTRIVSLPLTAIQSLLIHLLWHDKQRSEYFADHLAATIAGTAATEELLSKSALEEHLDAVLLRNAYSTTQSGAYILGLFRQRIEQLPSREWERLRRASELEGARLDSTHPPNAYRKAFLQAHRIAEPKFTVGANAMAAIDAELRGLEDRLGRRLIARFARD